MRRRAGRSLDELLGRMTAGRSGFDELSRFLLGASVLPLLICPFTRKLAGGYVSLFCFLAAMLLILWGVWRAFSSDRTARSRENANFTAGGFYREMSGAAVRFSQRKEYRFFRCPGCRCWLRVPRGRGKVEIRCPGCGSRFRGET